MDIRLVLIALLSTNLSSHAYSLNIGQAPPPVTLSDDNGGRTDGTPWSSASLTGKVHCLFYVDPDEKDINEKMEARFDKEDFPRDKFASVGVINMEATWMPNFAIEASLASKQEKFPQVTYVRDKTKYLVKKWNLKDDAYVVLVFDKAGTLVFQATGSLNKSKIDELMAAIKSRL